MNSTCRAGAIGIAFGFGAFGGLAGAALAPRVSRAIGLGRTAMIGVVLFPAPLALTALVSGPTWAKVAMLAAIELVSSVGVMLMDVNLNALLTAVTPDDARGRRAGAYSAVNYGIRPLGALGRWRAGHHHRAAADPGRRRAGRRARRALAARVTGAPHQDTRRTGDLTRPGGSPRCRGRTAAANRVPGRKLTWRALTGRAIYL